MTRQTYIQDPDTGKLVPAEEYDKPRHRFRKSFQIMPDIEEFVSPVDGSVVSSRSKLREHNARNDVVNFHEFDGVWEKEEAKRTEFFEGRSKEHRKEIVEDVIEATEKVAQGYKPTIAQEGELEHE